MEQTVAEQSPFNRITIRARAPRVRAFARRFVRNYAAVLGTFLILIVVLSAVLAPIIAPYSPNKQDIYRRLKPPAWQPKGSVEHILGTDQLGRDLFSRIVYGAQISLIIGLVSVVLSGVLGTALGITRRIFRRQG